MTHKEVKESIGSVAYHRGNQIEIIGFVEGSHTKVKVIDIDRGRGWCENTQRYIGFTYWTRNRDADCADGSKAYSWHKERGENRAFGEEFVAHRNSLNKEIES